MVEELHILAFIELVGGEGFQIAVHRPCRDDVAFPGWASQDPGQCIRRPFDSGEVEFLLRLRRQQAPAAARGLNRFQEVARLALLPGLGWFTATDQALRQAILHGLALARLARGLGRLAGFVVLPPAQGGPRLMGCGLVRLLPWIETGGKTGRQIAFQNHWV